MSNIIHQQNNLVKSDCDNLFPERSEAKSKGIATKFYSLSLSKGKISSPTKPPPDLKIIFLGTPEFAVPILEKLANSEFKPIAVFCAPDKPMGRKQTLTPPPIKIAVQKYGIPIYQPANSRELVWQSENLKCDLIISAAFGIILPKAALEIPQYGCLNIHPSLLPQYRGPSPIQAAILNGDQETGVTIYKMDEKIDHGPIITQTFYSLSDPPLARKWGVEGSKITTPELSVKLSELGAQLLFDTLPDWLAGKITPTPQDESRATYTKTIKKQDGLIDWQKSAQEIERQIRAYQPWPGAYSRIANGQPQIIKILKAKISDKNTDKKISEIFLSDDQGLSVQTGRKCLIIEAIQAAGGKALTAQNFLRGHKKIIGQKLF